MTVYEETRKIPVIQIAEKLSSLSPMISTSWAVWPPLDEKAGIVLGAKWYWRGKQYGLLIETGWMKTKDVTAEAVAKVHDEMLEKIAETIVALRDDALRKATP